MKNLTVADFAKSFGVNISDLSSKCISEIKKRNFNLIPIIDEDYQKLILKILKKIDEDKQIIGAPERKNTWKNGWNENLSEYSNSNFDLNNIIPKFIRSNMPIRWEQNYFLTDDPQFELNYNIVLRHYVYETFFKDIATLYEFGCGSGHNLVAASKILPNVKLIGTDFVQTSVDLVNLLGKKLSIQLTSDLFDMLSPNRDFNLEKNSAVFTLGALEQLASNIKPMINYLLNQKPKICVHIEPTIELYDENILSDYLAIKFQSKRGYSSGLLPMLKRLEREGRIKIIKVKRLNFGSLMLEGYNLMVWKPV